MLPPPQSASGAGRDAGSAAVHGVRAADEGAFRWVACAG
ncbi:hypothetical protein KCH_13860 [Kitasatospora cheerisanensis KCTC 2395]|uniref:Uncharacterized protein n=1 Tax=Kitasatospora cheerisanensis KCTC 2395 TaxID=1348663 RepID=A0A066Z9V0_9ACTN|nr:hypothetical protein KCH_13860 [Kitasatospora cheerisanensis KCTC 2395]